MRSIVLSAVLVLGCSSPARVCAPGATQPCACEGTASATQTCDHDGHSWLACECAPLVAPPTTVAASSRGSCGHAGEPCCAGEPYCEPGTFCADGSCNAGGPLYLAPPDVHPLECGEVGQPCCGPEDTCDDGNECANGVCVALGVGASS